MKKKLLIILVLILSLVPIRAGANDNQSVAIELFLDQGGNGHFRTEYVYDDYEKTEHYIVIENLQGRQLENFKVSRNGQPMEYVENWDPNASFDDKAGKYGIVQTDKGYELCFGITEYGYNIFTVSYTITNLVKNLNDYDMLYWRFLNPNLGDIPEDIYIKIFIEEGFNEENIRFWGYGFDGEFTFEDGAIVARSKPDFDYAHGTFLVRFDKGYFTGGLSEDVDFDHYYNLAMEGSDYDTSYSPDEEEDSLGFPGILGILGTILVSFGWLIPTILSKGLSSEKKLKYNKNDIYLDGYYYRETQDMPISHFYYILDQLGESEYTDYMTAYFLKWIKEARINLVDDTKGFFIKRDTVALRIEDVDKDFDSVSEEELFSIMESAAGDDGVLQEKEFSRYVSKNPGRLELFIDGLKEDSYNFLLKNDYIEEVERRVLLAKVKDRVLTDKGTKLARELIGFKNYLKDYSLLEEREAVNVHLWDEYMIYAGVFGITEEVQKQFKELYPRYVQESYYDPRAFYWSNYYARAITRSYNRSVAAAASQSASSGRGGGMSFGGGGAGFGGGGSGGGSR